MWIDFSSNEIDAPLMSWILPLWNIVPMDKKVLPCTAAAATSYISRFLFMRRAFEACLHANYSSVDITTSLLFFGIYFESRLA